MKPSDTPDECRQVLDLRAQNKSLAVISRELGISIHRVREYILPGYAPSGLEVTKSQAVTREDDLPGRSPRWAEWMAHLRQTQKFRGVDPLAPTGEVSLTFEEMLPIGISIFSDMHCGDSGVAYDLLDRHIQMVRDTPGMYCVMNGDELNNFIGELAWVGQTDLIQPNEQWQVVEALWDELQDSILVVTEGNHNAWTKKRSGVDLQKRILDRFGLLDIGDGAKLFLSVGSQQYTIMLRHKYRKESEDNPGNAVIAMHDEFGPFDVGIIGHTHVAAVGWQFRQNHQVIWIRPGSYKVLDKYADQLGYGHSIPLSPTLIFLPDRKAIRVYADIAEACEDLVAYRLRYLERRHGTV